MSGDLVLKSLCERCKAKSNLYGSNCKHMTICLPCGKHMAETKAVCSTCRSPVTSLIREYNVRASNIKNKRFSIGTFKDGLPDLFKKGSAAKWFMHKEGLKGPQLTDAMRDKYKNKPWIIEDESGKQKYQGKLEDSQQGTCYILVIHEREFLAIPVDEWYSFSKVAKYKQLSLEEAEEKMKNRRRAAEGFSRWMMKIANSGAKGGKLENLEGGAGSGRKKGSDETIDIVPSERGEEDEDEEERKSRLGLNKRVGDDNEEEVREGGFDADDDDDDIGKGDDWEHEEIFTDDDEAVGSDAEDEDESNSEVPVPPGIKQDGDESNEEEGEDLTISGKEMKKLLERQSRIDDDNEDRDVDEENHLLALLAQKKYIPKKETVKTTSTKAKTPASTCSTRITTISARAKRKSDNEDVKPSEASPTKKQKTGIDEENHLLPLLAEKKYIPKKETVKTTSTKAKTPASTCSMPVTTISARAKRKSDNEDVKPSEASPTKREKTGDLKSTKTTSVRDEVIPISKSVSTSGKHSLPASNKATVAQSAGPVPEEELLNFLREMGPVTTELLSAKFKPRIKTQEDKLAFAEVLKKISRLEKINGANYLVL